MVRVSQEGLKLVQGTCRTRVWRDRARILRIPMHLERRAACDNYDQHRETEPLAFEVSLFSVSSRWRLENGTDSFDGEGKPETNGDRNVERAEQVSQHSLGFRVNPSLTAVSIRHVRT